MLRSIVVAMMCAGALVARAQNEDDALRLSYVQPHGTARSASMANAFGALGADPVCALLNPAGIGLYVASEISLTPSFEVNDASSTYYGTSSGNTSTRFALGDFALVLHMPSDSDHGWRAGTFGITYDRIASYHWEQQAIGEHVNSSIVPAFVNEADGTPPELLPTAFPWSSGLAWDTYAIDPLDTVANTYVSVVPQGADMRHQHTISSNGAMSNTSLFFAGNYEDRFYLGASVGIIGTRLTRTTMHRETTLDEEIDIKQVDVREELTTKGNGVDVAVGAIVRIDERLRLGASFRSPMWLSMNDVFVTSMATTFRTPDVNGDFSYAQTSPDGAFAYNVRTPMSALLSAAYVVGSQGAVSVDYEWKDYRNARLNRADELADPYDFSAENETIRNVAAESHSVRVGTEWRAGPWRFRGGWGFWPDPYSKSDARHGLPLTHYGLGIGWRNDHLSVDLAANYAQRSTNYFPYNADLVDPISEDRSTIRTLLTFAWRP